MTQDIATIPVGETAAEAIAAMSQRLGVRAVSDPKKFRFTEDVRCYLLNNAAFATSLVITNATPEAFAAAAQQPGIWPDHPDRCVLVSMDGTYIGDVSWSDIKRGGPRSPPCGTEEMILRNMRTHLPPLDTAGLEEKMRALLV